MPSTPIFVKQAPAYIIEMYSLFIFTRALQTDKKEPQSVMIRAVLQHADQLVACFKKSDLKHFFSNSHHSKSYQ